MRICLLCALSASTLPLPSLRFTSTSVPLSAPPFLPQDDYQQAINVYMEALEHSPENPDILTTLGLLFLRCALFSLHAAVASLLAHYELVCGSVKDSLGTLLAAAPAAVRVAQHDSGTTRVFVFARNTEGVGSSHEYNRGLRVHDAGA